MTAPSPVFRHVLLTRFNARRPESTARPDAAWLRDRWRLFETYCLPSIARQTCKDFSWLVFFDAATDSSWRDRIEATASSAGFRPVFLDEPFTGRAAATAISAAGLDDSPFLITSRVDNDDALAPHFIGTVQHAFRPRDLEFVNLPLGYQLSERRVYLRPYLASSFASLVERVTDDPLRTVHFTEHHLIGRHALRQVWSPPAWLQVVHGDNLANEVRGIPVAGAGAATRFELDDVIVSSPSLRTRLEAVARFASRGLASPAARERAASVLRAGQVVSDLVPRRKGIPR